MQTPPRFPPRIAAPLMVLLMALLMTAPAAVLPPNPTTGATHPIAKAERPIAKTERPIANQAAVTQPAPAAALQPSPATGAAYPIANQAAVQPAPTAALQPSPAAAAQPEPFHLREHCPPSFQKTPSGTCALRTMYELYGSVQGKGLGGTQTALPPHRDGFTPQQIDLGRYLFFDPALSGDGTLSCAGCHQPDLGFGDGLPRSVGVDGAAVARAAPTLWNVGFLNSFFWDARASTLEEQMLGPLYAANEMGNNPARLLATLNGNATYRDLFSQAFPQQQDDNATTPNTRTPNTSTHTAPQHRGHAPEPNPAPATPAPAPAPTITLEQIYRALAAFQTSLISLNSRYDRYAHGHHQALSAKEIEGLNIFRSFVARCAECHTPPLFTNQQVAVLGAPEPPGLPFDVGAEATHAAPELKGGFKVPTLRNIALTAPYMHSGLFSNLRDVAGFYNGGRGHAVPAGLDLHLHWHISSPELREEELDRLVDFLGSLTDESLKPQTPRRVPSGLTPIAHRPTPGNP